MFLVGALTNLLYPPACLLCRAPLPDDRGAAGILCEACRRRMPRIEAPVCSRCGVGLRGSFDAQLLCSMCRATPLAFDLARSPWWYDGSAQEAIRQFKYARRWRIGRLLALEMAAAARSALPLDDVDAVLPVPLHWLKRRLKGFHPPAYLTHVIASALNKPYLSSALRRVRWTATQTALGWHQRFRNVDRAFAARGASVAGRSVLLVDDVLTSGATADACARTLKAAGARRVFLLTAARTPIR
ncbi:MAG: ComF family protein [Candidatus Omnitrophica bacterium]|nr:ComF family protein [Candidatus Omnitrophota bacterium]